MDVCVNLVGQEDFVIRTLMNAITLKVHVRSPMKNALILKGLLDVIVKVDTNEHQLEAVKVNTCNSIKNVCSIEQLHLITYILFLF